MTDTLNAARPRERQPLKNYSARLYEYLPLLLALIPVIALAVTVYRCAVDVPYMDEWEFVPLLQKAYAGRLTLGDIWAQHNEHRLLFPYLIMLGMARFTSWNIRSEQLFNLVLAGGILVVLLLQVRATVRQTGIRALSWSAPVLALLVFSFRQHENWLWGSQIQMFLSVLAVLGAIFLLGNASFSGRRLLGAAVLGVVASYSFANGLLIWPIGVLMILISPAFAATRRKCCALWLAAGVPTTALYFWGYMTPAVHPSPLDTLYEPIDYVHYVLAYLGGAYSGRLPRATALGGLGVALAAFAYWAAARLESARTGALVPYVAIGAYAAGTAMITGLGRTGLGVVEATMSRYATVSCLLWCCIVVLLLMACSQRKPDDRASLVRGICITALLFVTALSGVMTTLSRRAFPILHWQLEQCRDEVRQGVRDPGNIGPSVKLLYPDPDEVIKRSRFLAEKRLSLFRDDDF